MMAIRDIGQNGILPDYKKYPAEIDDNKNFAEFIGKHNNLEISKEESYIEDNGIFKFKTWRDADTGDLNDIKIKCGDFTLSNGENIDVEFKGSWKGRTEDA